MDVRRLIFPGIILLYFLALWLLNQQQPYEAFPEGPVRTIAYGLFQLSLYYIPGVMVYLIFFRRRITPLSNLIVGMMVVIFGTQLLLSLYFFVIHLGRNV